MASVGPQMYSRPPFNTITLRCWSPFLSFLPPRADVTPFLMCSGLMVVGHCLDRYSLLSVVFAVFHGHPSHGSLAQDILSLFALTPSMRTPPTRPLCGILLVRISLSVVSFQSLSRTALNVSLSRYVAFVFRLLVCLVPSHGGHGHVYQKVLRAKVQEDIFTLISCILTHLHLPLPTSPLHFYPSPSIPLVASSTSHPPGCGLLIYITVCEQLLRSQLRWTTHILGGPLHLP